VWDTVRCHEIVAESGFACRASHVNMDWTLFLQLPYLGDLQYHRRTQ